MWCFEVHYLPGKENACSDALSQNPSISSVVEEDNTQEEFLMAGISKYSTNSLL